MRTRAGWPSALQRTASSLSATCSLADMPSSASPLQQSLLMIGSPFAKARILFVSHLLSVKPGSPGVNGQWRGKARFAAPAGPYRHYCLLVSPLEITGCRGAVTEAGARRVARRFCVRGDCGLRLNPPASKPLRSLALGG